MARLVIVGAGGHGRVAADAAVLMRQWDEIAFFDDKYPDVKKVSIWPVESSIRDVEARLLSTDSFVVAIGNAALRQRLFVKLSSIAAPINIIHPSAVLSPRVNIGLGCVLFAGSVVNIGASLGDGVIINTGATVDHDCQLAAFSHICPGAHVAGDVVIGERTWIGVGAAIKHGVRIGRDVMVGAGAVVISDIPDACTVVGNPARVLAK